MRPFSHVHQFRHLAVQQRDRRAEAFELPDAHVVSREYPGRLQLLDQQPDDVRHQAVDAL